jgi:hypothetical protein
VSTSDEEGSDYPEPKRKSSQKQCRVKKTNDEVEVIDDKDEPKDEEEGVDEVSTTNRYLDLLRILTNSNLSNLKDDGLNDHHQGVELETAPIQKDLTVDLLAGDQIKKTNSPSNCKV